MEIGSALNTGVQGFQEATARANQAAQDIASTSVKDATAKPVEQKDMAVSLVELKQAEVDAKANVKVIDTATEMVGSLLDITV